jgi:L-alanine-DL-glutamate epimerase-like enolase superfamily enzyme
VLNALWDLFAKAKGVPLWKLLSDMSPEEIVAAIDFRYISDALTPAEALEILQKAQPAKAENEKVGWATQMRKCLLSHKKRSMMVLDSSSINAVNQLPMIVVA